jgi:hypothetical protein
MNFVKNYSIVDECLRNIKVQCSQGLVIEINFFWRRTALRDEFKVGLTSRYNEGSRPDEPDWFSKGTSVYSLSVGS